MSKHIIGFILGLFAAIFLVTSCYVIGSLVVNNFDIANWTYQERATTFILPGLIGVFIIAISTYEGIDK